MSLTKVSSSPAEIFGCADRVCSTMVVPERGKPTMNSGRGPLFDRRAARHDLQAARREIAAQALGQADAHGSAR